MKTSRVVGILRPVRTDYGKKIRKDYENGSIKISRHAFLEMKPRSDGISNTISTVQKDNLLMIEVIQVGQIYGTEREPNPQAGRIYDSSGISPCLDAMRGGEQDA